MRRCWLLPLTLLAVLLSACSMQTGDKDDKDDEKKKPKTIEVVPVGTAQITIGRIARSLSGSGTLRAAREVDVLAQSDGLVMKKVCDVGDRVEVGTVLAALDARARKNALEDARLALLAAEGKLVLAKISLEEQEQAIERSVLKEEDAVLSQGKAELSAAEAARALRAKRSLPPGTFSQDELQKAILAEQQAVKEVARAQLAVRQAKIDAVSAKIKQRELVSQVASAQRDIEDAKLALAKAQLELDKADVTAPIAGVVSECMLELGQRMTVGAVCYKLIDSRYFYLDLQMPEAELAVLRTGQPVLLTSALVNIPVLGRLERIAPAVDPRTGTVGVRIKVPDLPTGRASVLSMGQMLVAARLRRGMFVRAQIQVQVHPRAKLVPQEALVFENQQTYVYTVRDQKAVRVPVALGFAREQDVEIVTDALDEGAPVIVKGQRMIQHSSPVTVVEREGAPVEAPAQPAPAQDAG